MSSRDRDETGASAGRAEGSGNEQHPPFEVARQLRAARERAGYDLIDIAAALRIRHAHLLAIEEGRMTDLPGPAYAVGFLRSYAEILGLDGDAVVRLFKDEVRGFDGSGKLVFPAPVEEGKRPTAALVVLSLLVAGGVYGLWHYLSMADRTALESVSEPPERLLSKVVEPPPAAATADEAEAAGDSAPPLPDSPPPAAVPGPEPVASAAIALSRPPAAAEGASAAPPRPVADAGVSPPAASESAAEVAPLGEAPIALVAEAPAEPAAAPSLSAVVDAAPAVSAPPEPAVAPPPPAVEAEPLPPPPIAAPEAAEPPAAAPPARVVAAAPPELPAAASADGGGYVPQVYGAANAEARVVLRAEGDSWVQIQGANNELVLTRMLRAGDRYQVPDRSDLVMVTGNAGAIEITVDGKAIPRVGPMGAVRRDISLDAERLLARVAESQ